MRLAGVTPESIRSASEVNDSDRRRDAFQTLTDEEWQTMAPLLPAEPTQAKNMCNREFVDAVLKAMYHGGRWTDYPKKGRCSDAVRRRFGRWAHQGVWQQFATDTAPSCLSEKRKADLVLIAERAERLLQNR